MCGWCGSLRLHGPVKSKADLNARRREGFAVAAADEAFYAGYERESAGEACPGEQDETPDSDAVAKLDGAAPVPDVLGARNWTISPARAWRWIRRAAKDRHWERRQRGMCMSTTVSSVAAFTASGALIQRFGSGELPAAAGVAVDSRTGDVLAAESGENRVVVFKPEEQAGAPVVDGVSARAVGELGAAVGADRPARRAQRIRVPVRHRRLRDSPASCATVPVPAGEIAAGFGDQGVSVTVEGLQPATAYYYRVLASNASGSSGRRCRR